MVVTESAHKDSRHSHSLVLCDKKGAGVRHNVRGSIGMVAHGLENRRVTLCGRITPHMSIPADENRTKPTTMHKFCSPKKFNVYLLLLQYTRAYVIFVS